MASFQKKSQIPLTRLLLGKETIVFWSKTSLKLDLGGLFVNRTQRLIYVGLSLVNQNFFRLLKKGQQNRN